MRFSDLHPIDVFIAAQRLRGVVVRTPLRHSTGISARIAVPAYLKLECEQTTGSFKLRGAFNAIASLPDDVRRRGVVASSAGNHGLGVAWAARHFGVPARIFIPETAPAVKREGIESLGAAIDTESPNYDVAMTRAKEYAASQGQRFINPCLGEGVVAGQGTVGLEILEELPNVGTVIIPVGGGGLLGGIGSLFRAVAPNVRIIAAQSEKTAAMSRSVAAHAVVSIPSEPTLADGLAGDIDEFALDVGERAIDEIVQLSEDAIARAIAWLAWRESMVVEGSGAVGVAALLEGAASMLHAPVVIVVTGRNIDAERHRQAVAQANATRRDDTGPVYRPSPDGSVSRGSRR